MVPAPANSAGGCGPPVLDERTVTSNLEAERTEGGLDAGRGVDFASRRAQRVKARLWLAAVTAAAAVVIVAVVSVSVLHAG